MGGNYEYHETALYHFGTRYGECNVHLEWYLLKNTEETGNPWSHKLSCFLEGMNQARKKRILQGSVCFTPEELDRYCVRYEELLSQGLEENKHTRGRIAKKEEKALLKRLKKYRESHLLFLYDYESLIVITVRRKTFGSVKTARKWQVNSAQRLAVKCIATS